MGFGIWDTPSGRDRRWERRKRGFAPAPMYVRLAVVALATTLLATLVWQGVKRLLDPAKMAGSESPHFYVTPPSDRAGVAAWQTALSDALEQAVAQGVGGNITAAEMQTDRATTILMTTRMQGQAAPPDFFDHTVRSLDRVLRSHPDNERLIEHVTLARIELAQLRSAQPDLAAGGDSPTTKVGSASPAASVSPDIIAGPGVQAPHAVNIPGHVIFAAPRALSANELLDPAALRGNYIDATLMPDTSEVLLVPATRVMADGVRVGGLTIAGGCVTRAARFRCRTFASRIAHSDFPPMIAGRGWPTRSRSGSDRSRCSS
jgi:hypothetical protein